MVAIEKFLDLGFKAAKRAGNFLMSKYGKVKSVSSKERKDILTEVDLGSEKIILEFIRKYFPDHNILSEEVGLFKRSNSDYLWIIDPLDATVNYVSSLPFFSVSIGLVKAHQPIMGIVFAPYLDELFFAVVNKGAYLNDSKITVSKNNELSNCVINIGLSAHFNEQQIKKVLDISHKITPELRGIRMLESGTLTSCYVACSRLDGKISIKTNPFGNAASTVIVQEAKGSVTDFNNQSWSVNMKDMIVSNVLIHQDLLRVIK